MVNEKEGNLGKESQYLISLGERGLMYNMKTTLHVALASNGM